MDSNQIREFALNPVCSADMALYCEEPVVAGNVL